ncbi:MAG: ABC transporter transmembrane domain-containing protein [Pseudomonadota bacterium]
MKQIEGDGRRRDDHAPPPARAAIRPSRRPAVPQGFATGLWTYALRVRWRAQLGLGLLALVAAALNLAPVELQRRIIDDALTLGDMRLLLTLGALYAGALAAHQIAKYGLALGQAAVSERAAAALRDTVLGALGRRRRTGRGPGGEAASILNAEVDKLAGFVGGGPSGAIRDAATLLGLAGYMLWTSPLVAAAAFGLLLPQALLAPLMQLRLNRLVKRRLELLRALSEVASGDEDPRDASNLVEEIRRNRMRFSRLKALMKSLLNLLNALAPLGVLVVGGLLVIEGEVSLGIVVAFATGVERISSPVRDLISLYRLAAQAVVQHVMIRRWLDR